MPQADRVHNTPPTSTPIDPTRRRFLSQAAGGAALALRQFRRLRPPARQQARLTRSTGDLSYWVCRTQNRLQMSHPPRNGMRSMNCSRRHPRRLPA